MSYQVATKEEVENAGLEWKEPVQDTNLYATGPGGKLYKIPAEETSKYEVDSSEDDDHFPIMSYDDLAKMIDWEEAKKATEEEGEVAGHHLAVSPGGFLVWHGNVLWGPTGDGPVCYHYHPFGSPAWRA